MSWVHDNTAAGRPWPLDLGHVEIALGVASDMLQEMESLVHVAEGVDKDLAKRMRDAVGRAIPPKTVIVDSERHGMTCSACGWFTEFIQVPMEVGAFLFFMGALGAGHECVKHGGRENE